MKGIIEKYQGSIGCVWIAGEDGKTYFSHQNEFVNTQKISKGNIVSFVPVKSEDGPHMRANEVRKIGLGARHPFAQDAQRALDFISQLPETEERNYRIRDLRAIVAYFRAAEDFEWCRAPRERFCPRFQR